MERAIPRRAGRGTAIHRPITEGVTLTVAIIALLVLCAPAPAAAVGTAHRPARGCATAPGGGLGLNNIAVAGRQSMGVGADGLVATSSDWVRWKVRKTPVRYALRGVVRTTREWIVVGDVGTILSTSDLRRWRVASGVPAVGLRALAARPGLFAAAGPSGTVLSSTDGLTWHTRNSGTRAILWGGTHVGFDLVLSGQLATVITSRDGVSWRAIPTFPNPTDNQVAPRPFLWQLAFNRRRLVAVGDFGAVLEGSLSTMRAVHSPTDEVLRGVTFGGGVAVAVGSSGTILRSTASGRWLKVRSPTSVDLRGVAFTGSRFVAVGDESTVISSADGVRWQLDQTAMPCALLSVAHGNRAFVAVGGSGRVLTSHGGETWQIQRQPSLQDLYSVAHGRFGFVAVGARGAVLQSADGHRWSRRRVATALNLRAVTWDGREYLIGGDRGRLFTSRTGLRWRRVEFRAFHSLRDFATDRGVTVVVGAGTVGLRPPGGPWKFEPVGLGRFQTSAAAANGRFVVVGHNGEALVSTDAGSSWTAGKTGVDINLDRVSAVGGRFIATGEATALTSQDGLTWSRLSLPTRRSIRSLTVAGGVVTCVGDGGVILRSVDGGRHWHRVMRAP